MGVVIAVVDDGKYERYNSVSCDVGIVSVKD